MIGALIVACELGFWIVLGAGVLMRYRFGRRRLGGWLLAGVPVVDLILLCATAVDLAGGAQATWTHGLAALYLGFSVAFGHALVTAVDGWAARRAGAPHAPPRRERPSGRDRIAAQWHAFGKALVAGTLAAALLAGLVLIGGAQATGALWKGGGWFATLAAILVVWLALGPLLAHVSSRARRRPTGGIG